MRDVPRSAIAAQVLILINAAFWLGFALIAALGGLPGGLSSGPARWIFALLATGASATLGLLVFLLHRRKKGAFYLLLVILVILGTLSITDEVGIYDLFTLIVSLAAIVLLLINRSWYLSPADLNRSD